jgi:hypothetical protein
LPDCTTQHQETAIFVSRRYQENKGDASLRTNFLREYLKLKNEEAEETEEVIKVITGSGQVP